MSVHRGGRLDDEGLARLLAAMEAHLFVAEIDPAEGYRDVYTGPGEDRLLGGLPPEGEEPGEAWSARVDPRDEPRYREAMVARAVGAAGGGRVPAARLRRGHALGAGALPAVARPRRPPDAGRAGRRRHAMARRAGAAAAAAARGARRHDRRAPGGRAAVPHRQPHRGVQPAPLPRGAVGGAGAGRARRLDARRADGRHRPLQARSTTRSATRPATRCWSRSRAGSAIVLRSYDSIAR